MSAIADLLRQIPDGWREVRDNHGRLLCRYHPERDLLHFRNGTREAIVDLKKHRG